MLDCRSPACEPAEIGRFVTPESTPPNEPSEGRVAPFAGWPDVEKIGRIAASATVVAYILGLLIVNVYLYQIGVTDFSVLRTRFILTGFLATLPLMALALLVSTSALAVVAFVKHQRTARNRRRWRSRLTRTALSELILVLSYWTFVIYWLASSDIKFRSELFGQEDATYELIVLVILLFLSASSNLVDSTVYVTEEGEYDPRLWPLRRRGASIGALLPAGILLFVYIDIFASTFYPIIPEQFGGGRPKEAHIVLSEQSTALGTALGFGPATDGPMTRRVDLLWETEHMYVVRGRGAPDGNIIQIDRDAVSAVVLGSDATRAGTPAASPEAGP